MALSLIHETWHLKAACRGPESALFFPPSTPERRDDREAREAYAKQICAQCHVRDDCLEFALRVREPHGIWGGLTETERRSAVPRRRPVGRSAADLRQVSGPIWMREGAT